MLITSSGPRDWRKFFAPNFVVTLNGEVQKHAVEADDEAGYVIRYCVDADGKPIADGWRAKTERLEGAVVFTGTRRYSPDDIKAAAQAKRDRRAARNRTILNRAEVRSGGAA